MTGSLGHDLLPPRSRGLGRWLIPVHQSRVPWPTTAQSAADRQRPKLGLCPFSPDTLPMARRLLRIAWSLIDRCKLRAALMPPRVGRLPRRRLTPPELSVIRIEWNDWHPHGASYPRRAVRRPDLEDLSPARRLRVPTDQAGVALRPTVSVWRGGPVALRSAGLDRITSPDTSTRRCSAGDARVGMPTCLRDSKRRYGPDWRP